LVLTYANQLTILRMLFVPCFVILLIYEHPKSATVVFILAGITDGLDGLITLTMPSLPTILHIPAWLTILTISRDVIIALSALIIHLQTQHSQFPPTLLGKCTTAVQLLTVGICLLVNFQEKLAVVFFPWVLRATLAFTLASGLHYAYRSIKIIASYQEAEDDSKRDQNS
jgi:cardiolipin synthase